MLGMPANNSMAIPSGRRNHVGDNSVKNKAIPKLMGTAISKAMAEVANVPKMGTNAPYWSVTGFQAAVKRNFGPNALSEGQAPMSKEKIMAARMASTKNANSRVVPRNNRSAKCCRFRVASLMVFDMF